jgi:hypothetical protein
MPVSSILAAPSPLANPMAIRPLQAGTRRERRTYAMAVARACGVGVDDVELSLVAARMAAQVTPGKPLDLPRWAAQLLPHLFERIADALVALPLDLAALVDSMEEDDLLAWLGQQLRRDTSLAFILDTAAHRSALGWHVLMRVSLDQALEVGRQAMASGIS